MTVANPKSPSAFEVLIIDDQPDVKFHVKDLLQKRGYTVTWCTGWKDVENLLSSRVQYQESLPDVALVDMQFPNPCLGTNPALEGMEIIRALREACLGYGLRPLPAVGFTSAVGYLEKIDILKAGAQDFITEEEYQEPIFFARRLLQSVQDARVAQLLEPTSKEDIQEIEEHIVRRALERHGGLAEVATLLQWPLEEVHAIYDRLQKKESVYDS